MTTLHLEGYLYRGIGAEFGGGYVCGDGDDDEIREGSGTVLGYKGWKELMGMDG